MTPRPLPRSAYASKLREFPDFTFTDEGAFTRCGQWRSFFQDRIGSTFDDQIILELGCADASLLTTVAAQHPSTAFIGLDWKCKPLYDAATRLATAEIKNVALLRARAQDICQIFGHGEVDEIWIFHPEPCDTPDEMKSRLFMESFVIDAHAILHDDQSRLCLKTDHAIYAQSVIDLLASTRLFEITAHSSDFWNDPRAREPTAARLFAGQATPVETRFRQKRRPIHYIELRPR
jgi:tRNA (guanine-N7-)-methyltransferase